MARRFLCGVALGIVAGWKGKEKWDDMFGVPKPATVLAKVSQFWDDISTGGAAEKKKKKPPTTEEFLRREAAAMKAELHELHKELREEQLKLVAALSEEMKKVRDARPEDHQQGADSRPPPARLL